MKPEDVKRKRGSAVKKSDSKTTGRGKPKVEWQGYINVTITKEIANAAAAVKDVDQYVNAAMENLSDGFYDLKIKWDDYNQCWSASLYCQQPGNPNAGWCLSMRGDSWYKAMFRVLFVHFTVYEESWSAQGMSGWTDDQW